MMRNRWMAFALLAGIAACVPTKAAEVPTHVAGQSPNAVFSQYQLTGNVDFLGGKWKRGDGEFQWAQLEEVARQFPESSDVYDRANTRATVLSTASAAGGLVVGMTFGWNIAASDDERWSSGTQQAAYGLGAGLIVATLFAATVWHNPAEDFADVYNRALRRQLGLPPSSPAPTKDTPAWVPRMNGANGVGWTF